MSEWHALPAPFDRHTTLIVAKRVENSHLGPMGAVIRTTYMHAGRRYEVETSNGGGRWRWLEDERETQE